MMFFGSFSIFMTIILIIIFVSVAKVIRESFSNENKNIKSNKNHFFEDDCIKVENLVLIEKIYSIEEISRRMELSRNDTIKVVKSAIYNGALKGFTINYPQLRIEQSLITNLKNVFNNKIKQDSNEIIEVRCQYCGTHQNSNRNRCDCCGAPLRK